MARDVVDPKIFDRIKNHPKIKELGIKTQSIRNGISGIHKKNHGVTISAAASEYAKAHGFSVYGSLSTEDKNSLIHLKTDSNTGSSNFGTRNHRNKRKSNSQLKLELPKGVKIRDPLLPKSIVNDAVKMANVYLEIYLFENSIRNLILKTLEKKHGKNWWKKCVSHPVQNEVTKRIKKEKKNRWHSKRGAHPIYYSNIGDLMSIISKNWNEFKDVIEKEQAWIKLKIEEIEFSRNVIAHNNPLLKDDIQRIEVNFKDWFKQIGSYQSS